MSADELFDVFTKLKEDTFESEEELRALLPQFVEALEYDEENLFFEVSIEPHEIPDPSEVAPPPRPDAAIKANPQSPPWMIIETGLRHGPVHFPGHRGEMARIEENRLDALYSVTSAEYCLFFSNELLTFISGDGFGGIKVDEITLSDAENLFNTFSAPETLPSQTTLFEADQPTGTLEGSHFELDLNEYRETVQRVEEAESSVEKGKSLEDLTTLLFDSVAFFTVRETNFRTTASEIDVIVENLQTDDNPFVENYDRFILAESKNWDDSIGASEVRDFTEKIRSVGLDLGVIVAPEGVTGESGRDAVDQLNQVYQNDRIVIVVIDGGDFEAVLDGANFYKIFESKVFERRFRKLV